MSRRGNTMRNFDTEDIKAAVSITDVVERYCGIHPARNGRVPCPFHNGQDNNMALYEDNGTYHCFVCGANGDVIRFVQDLFSVGFIQACKTLNEDFGLGLTIDRELTGFEKREMERKRKRREQQKEFGESAIEWRQENLEKAELLYITCDRILNEYNPKRIGKLTKLFIWACHNIASAENEYNKYK